MTIRVKLLIITILIPLFSYSQVRERIDSILNIYQTSKNDSIINNAISDLGVLYGNFNLDSSEFFAQLLIERGKAQKDEYAVATGYHNLGGVFLAKGVFKDAIESFQKAEKGARQVKEDKLLASCLNSIGLCYYYMDDIKRAIEYYNQVTKIESLKDDYDVIGTIFNNIGGIYYNKEMYDSAVVYFEKSLFIGKMRTNNSSYANTLNNLSATYNKLGKHEKAIEYLNKAIAIHKANDDLGSLVFNYVNLASSYSNIDKKKMLTYALKAVEIGEEIKENNGLISAYKAASEAYSKNNDYKNAFEYQKKYTQLKVEQLNRDRAEKIAEIEGQYETEKKNRQILELENEKIEQEQKLKQSKLYNSVLIGGGTLVLIIAILIGYFLFQNRKKNKILEDKNQEISTQKLIVETKNSEILDSINYAKRLQDAILPPLKLVKEYLSESFVYYQPKDIIAGDFYWMENINDYTLFAAADCTGHGVPGALVSVVCSNALNRTVKEFEVTEPGKILDKVRELVIETFEKSENKVNDGMDISLCAYNQKTKKMKWAGANNPLWIVRKNEVIEIKPNKQPIGVIEKPELFTTHTIQLEKGDTAYIFSDGYVDQFGGKKGKKYKSANFKELLLSIQNEPMKKQKEIIANTFEKWKGSLEQIDDVCVIGVRI